MLDFEEMMAKTETENRSVVRVSTTSWSHKGGISRKRTIRFVRRLSKGRFHILEEEAYALSAEEAIDMITNLDECRDGLYFVDMTNVGHDFETGYVDDYDLRLVPYKEPTEK